MRLRLALLGAALSVLGVGCRADHRVRVATPGGQVARAGGQVASAACRPGDAGRAPYRGEAGVYRAGVLTLVDGEDLARLPQWRLAHPAGSEAIVVVAGDRPVVLSVDTPWRRRFALEFTPLSGGSPTARIADGRAAVRFPACGQAVHRFLGGILFAGRGCMGLHVRTPGRRAAALLLPVGRPCR